MYVLNPLLIWVECASGRIPVQNLFKRLKNKAK